MNLSKKIEILLANKPADFYGYKVFPDGRIWGKRGDWPLKIQWKRNRNGDIYLYYCLFINRKKKNYYAHRLVAECFIGYIPEGHQVDHLNNDTTDPKLTNVGIVTESINKQRRRSWKK